MKKVFASIAVIGLLAISAPAQAVVQDYGVDIYMSAPKVEGPSISPIDIETFDSAALGACPADLVIGTLEGDCEVDVAGTYGGATVSDDTPVSGGVGTNYATTIDPTTSFTITLKKPAKYLGLWWSAGSPSNTIEFYSGTKRVALMTTANLMTLLGNASVTAKGGSTYNTADYFGNPRDTSLASEEPFLYLNLYGIGGASFNRIVMSGGGFEFDNIATSDLTQTPGDGEVKVDFIPGENKPKKKSSSLASTGSETAGFAIAGLIAIAAGAAALRRRQAQ